MTGEQERIVRRVREELEMLDRQPLHRPDLLRLARARRRETRTRNDPGAPRPGRPPLAASLMRLSDLGFDLMQELGVDVSLRPVALSDLVERRPCSWST